MNNETSYEISDDQALKDLLMDIESLDKLSPWSGKLNIFDVLKITKAEIRHSNMLSWLMDPNESHGLQDSFLRGIFQMAIKNADDLSLDVFKVLLMDFESFLIHREWKGIDILAKSEEEKVLLCVENKIGANEHGDQLNRYQHLIERSFPDYVKIYLYLTPDGFDSSFPDLWQSISYRELMMLLESCMERFNLSQDTHTLIQHYIEAVRRDIVGDEKLKRICGEIYAKHRQALDLIFENRPDEVYYASEVIIKWCEEKASSDKELFFDPSNSVKTSIRFTTKNMSSILPNHGERLSGWRTHSMYFYEIHNKPKVSIKLALSSKNLSDKQKVPSDRLGKMLKPRDKRPHWQWRTIYSSNTFKIDPESETYEEDIYKKLDALWNETKRFEQDLMVKWSNEDVPI